MKPKRVDRLTQQLVSETSAFGVRGYAELRDVPHVIADKTHEHYTCQPPRGEIESHERAGLEKRSAAGKLDDVIDKSARACQRSILVVDPAVDMVDISKRDRAGSRFMVMFGPRLDMEAAEGRTDRHRGRGSAIKRHQNALLNLHTPLSLQRLADAGIDQQQLALDPAHVRRPDQAVEDRLEQPRLRSPHLASAGRT